MWCAGDSQKGEKHSLRPKVYTHVYLIYTHGPPSMFRYGHSRTMCQLGTKYLKYINIYMWVCMYINLDVKLCVYTLSCCL